MKEREIHMKKIVALTLVLVMVLALCACGGGSKSGPDGSYKLTGLKVGGEDYSAYIDAAGYGNYTITFNSDGTGKLVGSDANISFTWDEKNIDDGTDVIPYTFTSNSVSFETEGVEMTFTK